MCHEIFFDLRTVGYPQPTTVWNYITVPLSNITTIVLLIPSRMLSVWKKKLKEVLYLDHVQIKVNLVYQH